MASRVRQQCCKIVLATSLVWLFLDALLLMYFADCTQPSRSNCETAVVGDTLQPIAKKPSGLLGRLLPQVLHNPTGPGEMGKAVVIPDSKKAEAKEKFKINQFNLMASDMISVNRSLRDVRMSACQSKSYPDLSQFGTTSVIIVFHNEAWSTLLRTVHSVINRSPRQLLEEIILVDDASEREHLKQRLQDYISKLSVPVHVERMVERTGLMRARLRGASVAKGKILTFLDSHCECTTGWLEPLLYEIYKDRKTVVCPIIDVISDDTFEYITGSDMTWGGFNWKLNFRWYSVPKREMTRRNGDRSLPLRSPTMAGGLLSVEKNYFYEIGSYDDGMNIWGGENLEMSFRVWMCGGHVLIATCSRVGHVFRKTSPYTWPGGVATILNHNTRRTAEVWMDGYQQFYYKYNPGVKLTDMGDISGRQELRKRLQCKSFRWYLENVYPESQMPLDYFSLGEIRNKATGDCIDTQARKSGERVGVVRCHGQGGNQVFSYTKSRALQADDLCLDVSNSDGPVKLFRCHGLGGNQAWLYQRETLTLRHVSSNLCLGAPTAHEKHYPSFTRCNGSPQQQWLLSDMDWNKLTS